jgi:pyruvate dehydrogenase E2 component (dihydrolipoamide acetyltransferase)
MGAITEVKVPDIGDFKDVPVIEVLVKPGDTVKPEDALVTLESDKATMDVPAPVAGVVKDLLVKVGDRVSEGSGILTVEAEGARAPAEEIRPSVATPPAPTHAPAGVAEVRVPDIGEFKDVPVIELLVKPGDSVKPEQPLITLESDKATMEVPAPLGGVVREMRVNVGDKVSEGAIILTLATEPAGLPAAAAPVNAPAARDAPVPAAVPARGAAAGAIDETAFALAYASPAVRKLARELGVDLGQVKGAGRGGRILKADVRDHAKARQAAPSADWTCSLGHKSISQSSARSNPSRSRASRRSRGRICTATG